ADFADMFGGVMKMSAIGPKRTSVVAPQMSAFGSKADIGRAWGILLSPTGQRSAIKPKAIVVIVFVASAANACLLHLFLARRCMPLRLRFRHVCFLRISVTEFKKNGRAEIPRWLHYTFVDTRTRDNV